MGKYEEALERARQGLPMDEVFPELKGSEDERIRKSLIEFLREAYSRGNAPEECAKWLVWLDWQKEQQPAEWSEEDEKMRSNLMSLLANMRGDRITEETYQKYYPWLKALRPSWKPSEEQMSDLWRAATMNTITCPNLKSLYEDLKKL